MTNTIEDLQKMIGGISTLKDLKIPEVMPTGIRSLDYGVLGIGGFPRGRFTEMYAKEGVGKTSVCLAIAGLFTQQKMLVGWIESEGTLTGEYAEACGVDSDYFHIIRDYVHGEDALLKINRMLATNMYDFIVLDSMPKLVPQSIIEASSDKASMYNKFAPSTMFATFINKLNGFEVRDSNKKLMTSNKKYEVDGKIINTHHKLSDKKTHIIFINHAMDDLGAMSPGAVTTPGGRKVKFESTFRLWLKNKGTVRGSDGILTIRKIGIVAQKNKLAPPFGYTTLLLHANGKLEAEDDDTILIDIAIGKKLIRQAGAWYHIKPTGTEEGKDIIKLKGKEKVVEYIKGADEFKNRILAHE